MGLTGIREEEWSEDKRKELEEKTGIHIGDKVMYIEVSGYNAFPVIRTVKDIYRDMEGFVCVVFDGEEGYVTKESVYTKEQILAMFGEG